MILEPVDKDQLESEISKNVFKFSIIKETIPLKKNGKKYVKFIYLDNSYQWFEVIDET